MPQIEAQQLYKDLESGRYASLYFLHGDEPYLLNDITNRFRHGILPEGMDDFNLSSFYAADADINQVRDAVETLPMMCDRRLVILRECQDLTDKEWQILEPLFKTPVESTIFVLVGGKVDKRKKQLRLLMEIGDCVEFKKPYDNQVPAWIKHIAKNLEMQISNDAIHLLHRLVGSNLFDVESELQKLQDFVGSKDIRIEREHVEKVVDRVKEDSVFDLTRAIGESNRVQAIELVRHLLQQGQNEGGVISLIARHIRLLLLVKRGQDLGYTGNRLAEYSDVRPFFLEQYVKQNRTWTKDKLEHVLSHLHQTDRAFRSSKLSTQILLENLILKVCAQ